MNTRFNWISLAALSLLGLGCGDTPSGPAVLPGPIAKYSFTGSTLDVSGQHHDGVNHGTTFTSDRFGRSLSAIDLNGSSWIEVANSSDLNLTAAAGFSISAWVKAGAAQPEAAGIVCKGSAGIHDPGYQMTASFTRAFAQVSSLHDLHVTGTSTITDNKWHLLTMVVDSASGMKLYVDGVQEGTAIDRPIYPERDNAAPLFIGKERNSEQFFTGAIDDVAIYNRAISSSEVVGLYNSTE